MLVIGLCGKTGSGKSTVGRYYETLGAAYIDTDKVSREVAYPGSVCLNELALFFGSDILNEDGSLNRKKLAEKTMDGGRPYEKLNEITHSHILSRTRELIAEIESEGKSNCVVVDAPLLFESGFYRECDYIIGVIAPADISLKRVMKRDGISDEEVTKRLEMQKSDEFLKENCDYIIINDSTEEELIEKAKMIFNDIGKREQT